MLFFVFVLSGSGSMKLLKDAERSFPLLQMELWMMAMQKALLMEKSLLAI